MHRALAIEEIQHEVCGHLQDMDRMGDVLALSRTSRVFQQCCVGYAWRTANQHACRKLAMAMRPKESSCEARIKLYTSSVRDLELYISASKDCLDEFNDWSTIMRKYNRKEPIFPRLDQIWLRARIPAAIKQIVKFISPTLRRLRIDQCEISHQDLHIANQAFSQLFTKLIENKISLETLVLNFPKKALNNIFEYELLRVLTVMSELVCLSINSSLLSVAVLHAILTLPSLTTLVLHSKRDSSHLHDIVLNPLLQHAFHQLQALVLRSIDVADVRKIVDNLDSELLALKMECYVTPDTHDLSTIVERLAAAIANRQTHLLDLEISILELENIPDFEFFEDFYGMELSFEAFDPTALICLKNCEGLHTIRFRCPINWAFLVTDKILNEISLNWSVLEEFTCNWSPGAREEYNTNGIFPVVPEVSLLGVAHLANNCPKLNYVNLTTTDLRHATEYPNPRLPTRPVRLHLQGAKMDKIAYPAMVISSWVGLDLTIADEEDDRVWMEVLGVVAIVKEAAKAYAEHKGLCN